MNKFDYGSHVEALVPFESQGAAAQQQQDGAQSFSAGRNNISGNTANQGNARVESARDNLIDLKHLRFDDGKAGF